MQTISEVAETVGKHHDYIGVIIGVGISVAGFVIKIIGSWLWKKFTGMSDKLEEVRANQKIIDADLENTKNILHEMRGEIRADIKRIDEKCSRRHEK